MAAEKKYTGRQEDGRNTVMLIGILVLLIIVVGGALIYTITSKKAAPEQPSLPPAQNATNLPQPPPQNQTNATVQCGDRCIMERALAAQNASACGEIQDAGISQDCYGSLANVSLAACTALTDAAKRKSCVTAFAVSAANVSLCDLISEGKDACRLAVDPCYGSSDRKLCEALYTGNPRNCGDDTACLLNYSTAKKDEASCNLIQSDVVSTACRSAVTYSDKCAFLPRLAERDYCYELFAIYSDDYLTCTQITPNSVYGIDCYSIFAARRGNLSICDNDGFSLNELWYCYTNYSLMTGDMSGCREIDELAVTNKFRCSSEYAKKFGDPSACELVESASSRTTCYSGAIIYFNKNLDWTKCDDVTVLAWRNECFTEAAKLNDDILLCDYIEDSPERGLCKDSYLVYKNKK